MLMENDTNSKRAKHIDIRCYFIRDYIKKKVLKLVHVPSSWQLADLYTKVLPAHRIAWLSKYVLGISRTQPEALR